MGRSEAKREINLAEHGVDFADIHYVFESETWTVIDDRYNYGEVRYYTLGLLEGRVLAIIHTEEDNFTRLISARKANRNETERYFKKVRD